MNPVTTQQLSAIHAILHRKGLLAQKATIVESFTNGRSSSSKDLSMEEARELIMFFNEAAESVNKDDKGPMIRKLFAMAHEIGWITQKTYVTDMNKQVKPATDTPPATNYNLETKKDYSRVYGWVLKYGYLKKELRKYTYKELPKLLSQFEFGPYKEYISKK